MTTVWIGQALLTLAGLTVLVSASLAPYDAAFGLVSTLACTLMLLRQVRVAHLRDTSAA